MEVSGLPARKTVSITSCSLGLTAPCDWPALDTITSSLKASLTLSPKHCLFAAFFLLDHLSLFTSYLLFAIEIASTFWTFLNSSHANTKGSQTQRCYCKSHKCSHWKPQSNLVRCDSLAKIHVNFHIYHWLCFEGLCKHKSLPTATLFEISHWMLFCMHPKKAYCSLSRNFKPWWEGMMQGLFWHCACFWLWMLRSCLTWPGNIVKFFPQ